MTTALAVLQTIAGFGAILATIIFTHAQRRWARQDALRTRMEFIDAAIDLVSAVDTVTVSLVSAGPVGPNSVNGATKQAWIRCTAETNDALQALRLSAPPDAAIVMSLTRCVRALRPSGNAHLITSHNDLADLAAHVAKEMKTERENLVRRRALLSPWTKPADQW
jgi:hypothetical protein